MTDDRSLERAARSWLELGPTKAPDHAVDAALLLVQTTNQERDWRAQLPWRNQPMTMPARLMAAAIAIAVVTVGGILILRPGGSSISATPSPTTPAAPSASSAAAGSPSVAPPASARVFDYSALGGRILVEHFGNAPDGSESSSDAHTDRVRLYWMDPATMTGATATELLPGWNGNGTGKVNPAISPDGTTIVFEEANIDYPGLRTTPTTPVGIQLAETQEAGDRCHNVAKCAEIHPALGPNGLLAYVVVLGGQAWIQVDGPGEGQTRELRSTRMPDSNVIPEGLSFTPDGKKIAFGRVGWDNNVPMSGKVAIVDIASDQTTVLPIALQYPGDPGWIDGGSRLVVTDGPKSMAAVPMGGPGRTAELYTVALDGTDLRQITHTSGQVVTANVMSDGRVMFFDNYLWIVNADGTDPRPVNIRGEDLSTFERGFSYVGLWVAP